jgi:RNA polymerase sigma-70 factor (ECF subfamily)
MNDDHTETETRLRDDWNRGDFDQVTTGLVKAYGHEVLEFLIAKLHSAVLGQDAYSMFLEDLWLGVPSFRWRCSLRAWAYVLARHAASRVLRRRAKGHVPLSDAEALVADSRTHPSTQLHLRTDVKERMQNLRAHLKPQQQDLLILRADRRLSWHDLAVIMGRPDASEEEIAAESARLRKRYERIKTRLRALAQKEGLLPDSPL